MPLTNNDKISKKLGTRHRAAIGITETSDALTIIVSEETGTISLAVNGRLVRNYDRDKLKKILVQIIKNRQSKKITLKERDKVMDKEGKQQYIIKICCVIAAFALWLFITSTENPVTAYKIKSIPVQLLNTDILTQFKSNFSARSRFNYILKY